MAGSSLLTLIDDIALLLDDVAVLTKVAAKKTAGVLGDDLALNAQQVAGVATERELPVVWAVFKGSAVNKLILVPAALLISAFEQFLHSQFGWQVPIVMTLMMLGGLFLCYEGVEKLSHAFLHGKQDREAHHQQLLDMVNNPQVDMVAFEQGKIKGAIRTDFILSAEIIVLTLGAVAHASFATQVGVLCAIAILMTVGVYGLVAGIVKIDDAGLYLSTRSGLRRAFGRFLLWLAPYLMKFLSIAGTTAMFLVGGGIFTHNIHALHSVFGQWAALGAAVPVIGGVLGVLGPLLLDLLFGILAGILALLAVKLVGRLFPGKPTTLDPDPQGPAHTP